MTSVEALAVSCQGINRALGTDLIALNAAGDDPPWALRCCRLSCDHRPPAANGCFGHLCREPIYVEILVSGDWLAHQHWRPDQCRFGKLDIISVTD